jgi:tRNA modification GTPase
LSAQGSKHYEETIVALATPPGVSAIAVIRLSGPDTFPIVNRVFRGKDLEQVNSHTLNFGNIVGEDGTIIDEVLVSVFHGPHSFTKEHAIEISTHGSPYIIKKVIELLLENGARLARPGEFTKRAFLNGRFDLAQAEAVADLIASDSEAAHRTAMNQMRGGFSEEIKRLREKLVHFASMIELELDFSEEDVEFADRKQLEVLILELLKVINRLADSFSLGNVIKTGVPTVIAGKPNAGKSTLLNALLNEEKAIVSDIPGTTRDVIEDEIVIEGVSFRFIDTAGLRETTDTIEAIGVQRSYDRMKKASVIIYLFDLSAASTKDVFQEINQLENLGVPFLKVGNKKDIAQPNLLEALAQHNDFLFISTKDENDLHTLRKQLIEKVNLGAISQNDTVVTNARHYESLIRTREALEKVLNGLEESITNDFLAMDIRHALNELGEITGEITTDDLLANIFSKFCIGK